MKPVRAGAHEVRLTLNERQLRTLARGRREALAADPLRQGEILDAQELLELIDAKLPSAEERHPAARGAGALLLDEEILRVLVAEG